uniref:Major capsid protein N-terminal domain-containing protein n=1 Tax=viral metagenome TaxID=1070528 RepID=A0A6C0J5W1_9ZZZZ
MGYGKQFLNNKSTLLSDKPNIVFWKKVYKRKSNISKESIPQYFKKTVPNFGERLTVNISKSGDLIKELILFIELPEIQSANHSVLPPGVKKFAWVDKIGLAIIKSVEIEIGGLSINKHYSDWLNIQYESNYIYSGLDKLIGKNVKMLTDYTNGKNSYKLYIPLQFFFSFINELALPIISLSKQDIKLNIEFNDLNYCIKESPTHYLEISNYICLFKKGELIRQNVNGNKAIAEFVYFDAITQKIYYNKISNHFNIPSNIDNKYAIIGDNSKYSIIPKINSSIVKDEEYFKNKFNPYIKNTYLIVNYIYLDSNERWFFLNNDLEYIVPLVKSVFEDSIKNMNYNFMLKLSHPHKILFWRAQLESEIERNNHFNYTTYPITLKREPIILNNTLIINSIPRTEISNYEFYTFLQNHLNNYFYVEGLHQYSFSVEPNNDYPNGTLNFSKIDYSYIKLLLNNIVNYKNSINMKAYGIYYNILIIKNGTSSIKYAI